MNFLNKVAKNYKKQKNIKNLLNIVLKFTKLADFLFKKEIQDDKIKKINPWRYYYG